MVFGCGSQCIVQWPLLYSSFLIASSLGFAIGWCDRTMPSRAFNAEPSMPSRAFRAEPTVPSQQCRAFRAEPTMPSLQLFPLPIPGTDPMTEATHPQPSRFPTEAKGFPPLALNPIATLPLPHQEPEVFTHSLPSDSTNTSSPPAPR